MNFDWSEWVKSNLAMRRIADRVASDRSDLANPTAPAGTTATVFRSRKSHQACRKKATTRPALRLPSVCLPSLLYTDRSPRESGSVRRSSYNVKHACEPTNSKKPQQLFSLKLRTRPQQFLCRIFLDTHLTCGVLLYSGDQKYNSPVSWWVIRRKKSFLLESTMNDNRTSSSFPRAQNPASCQGEIVSSTMRVSSAISGELCSFMAAETIPDLVRRNYESHRDSVAVVYDDGESVSTLTFQQLHAAAQEVRFCQLVRISNVLFWENRGVTFSLASTGFHHSPRSQCHQGNSRGCFQLLAAHSSSVSGVSPAKSFRHKSVASLLNKHFQ